MELKSRTMNLTNFDVVIGFVLNIVSIFIFIFGYLSESYWQPGWFVYGLTLIYTCFLGIKSFYSKIRRSDILLFSLGYFFFLCMEPFIFSITNQQFPISFRPLSNINALGNLTGIIVSFFFSLFFYFGAFCIKQKGQNSESKNLPEKIYKGNPIVFFLASAIPLFAFLANGEGFSIANAIETISARTQGYVAFADSGLGNTNAFFALLAACSPVGVIIYVLGLQRRKILLNIFLLSVSLILFFLYVASGGRTGVILVFGSIALYILIYYKIVPRIGTAISIFFLGFILLSIQINFRNVGFDQALTFQQSAIVGFNLNREVSLIADNYGERRSFIAGDTFYDQVVKPIPETIVLFVSNPVPRTIWADKPIDESFAPYNVLRTGATGFGRTTNITPTIPGRYYMKYGISGIVQIAFIFGILWALINNSLNTSRTKTSIIFYCIFSLILFISIRDLAPGKFYPLLYLLLFQLISAVKIKT